MGIHVVLLTVWVFAVHNICLFFVLSTFFLSFFLSFFLLFVFIA